MQPDRSHPAADCPASCVKQRIQFKGNNLPFQFFQGMKATDSRYQVCLPASLEEHELHHSSTKELQAHARSVFTLPGRSEVSIVHQHQVALPNVGIRPNKVLEIDFRSGIHSISVMYCLLLQELQARHVRIANGCRSRGQDGSRACCRRRIVGDLATRAHHWFLRYRSAGGSSKIRNSERRLASTLNGMCVG